MSRRKNKHHNDDLQEYYSEKLNNLNHILHDTNQDLQEINQNLKYTKHNLRDDRNNSQHYANLRSSYSDAEEYNDYSSGHRVRKKVISRSSRRVRSRSNQSIDESIHDLHKKIRDLSFDHDKLADEFEQEREAKYSTANERGKSFYAGEKRKQHSSDVDSSIDERIENRLQQVYSRIKKKYTAQNQAQSVNDEIKRILEELKNSAKKENSNNGNQKLNNECEMSKQKTQSELIAAKRRLIELEESKISLTEQVKRLKEQLDNLESHTNMRHNADLTREIEQLKKQLQSQSWQQSSSIEFNLSVEKYKKEVETLNESNQALRMLLKERESKEWEQKMEIKALQDRLEQFERENSRLNQINTETIAGIGRLRLVEEELEQSERKRDELKQDAEETIKLWKNKVKKLEKSLESNRIKQESLSQQMEMLKENAENLGTHCEGLQQENLYLKESNKKLDEKCKLLETNLNKVKHEFDEYKSENVSLKLQTNDSQKSVKAYESKWNDVESERAELQSRLQFEEGKSNDLNKKSSDLQNQVESLKNEKKEHLLRISRLEDDCQKLKSSLEAAIKSKEETKSELDNISKQTKQNYDETVGKYGHQLQQAHYQLQKIKLESEEKLRSLQLHLAEERSNFEIAKKRENEYLTEIEDIRIERNRLEEELSRLKSNYDIVIRNDNEKTQIFREMEEKNQKLMEQLSYQNTHCYNTETDFIKILNQLSIDIDLLISTIEISLDKNYQSIIDFEQSDKVNMLYIRLKHKINWVAKNLEELLQLKYKFHQEIIFLEHELDSVKKNSVHNLKAQNVFLRNLETQNTELLADREIAYRNMELFEKYLMDLTDSVKHHSNREIQRTQHLLALDNIKYLSNNKSLSEDERNEIYDRFKRFKNTINEIKSQLDSSNRKAFKPEQKCTSRCQIKRAATTTTTTKKQVVVHKPKPFK